MKTITKNLLIVVAMITTVMIIGCPHNSPKPEPEYKEPARYTVSFHKNDTNAKGSMDPQTFVEGVEQKLTPNLFDLTNHEFKGWALTPEGDKKYIDQQSITVSSDMTLYAVWEQKICTITFEKNADDAVGSMNSQQLENSIPERISKNTFTRPNFEFLGWATSPDGEKVYEDNQEISLKKSITLYAKWAREIVYVSFEKNAESATGEMEPQSFGAGDPLTLKPNAFENTGYKFAGWALTADGTKQYDDAEKITITANTTLYALWEIDYKKVTVTHWQQNLADDGYTEVVADKTEHDVQITKEFTATAKTYTGFKLKTTPTPITINGDMTIPVYYDREVYTLTLTNFDASYFTAHKDLVGASLQGNTLTGRYGAEISALNDNKKIRREKYVFLSWKPIIPSTLTSNGTHTANWEFFEMKTGPEINEILKTLEHANCSFVPSNLAPSYYSGSIKLTTDNSTKHCYVWKDGNTIYYYAEGYTNGSKLIPLNADSSKMFSNLKFVNIDLSKFNTSNVTDMSNMFNMPWGSKLTAIDLSNFDTSNVTNMSSMFYNCEILTSLDLSSFNTSNVTNMSGMFYNCNSLTSLDLSKFNTSNVTSMEWMFDGCSSLTSLDLTSFDTSNVTDMQEMFYNCSSLTSLDLSSFNTSKVTYMSDMFYGCSSLTNLDLSSFNTSKVTDMTYMFCGCRKLTNLDLSSFDTSKVTDMRYMFSNCTSLTSLDLSSFNTSNVTYMHSMFNGCSSLTSLDLSCFNTSKVTYMVDMFNGCSSLTSLDLSCFNTSNVTNMQEMFYNCSSLTSLDLSSFNTSKVTYMSDMFYGCSSLTSLDLSSFDTSKVIDMSIMFYNCSLLTSIYVKPNTDWSTSSVLASSTIMFTGCKNLIGGNGTVFNTNKTDKAYARVDGLDGKPGYFTAK